MSKAVYFFPWVLLWAASFHTVTATGLLLDPDNVKPILVLTGLDIFVNQLAIPTMNFAVVLYMASAMALMGIAAERRKDIGQPVMLGLVAPQYVIVTIGLLNDLYLTMKGEYAGEAFEFWPGLVALSVVMFASLYHNASVIERYVIKWKDAHPAWT